MLLMALLLHGGLLGGVGGGEGGADGPGGGALAPATPPEGFLATPEAGGPAHLMPVANERQ
eukprot:COSAG02_NODE_1672_length_11385_cov_7.810473_5_plen_61_part_00